MAQPGGYELVFELDARGEREHRYRFFIESVAVHRATDGG
jgi:hypothetical protein